jgi:hypothetical protein
MATVPLSGTNIRLLSGVPFSNDYKHSRWFDTSSAQETYFLGKTVVHSMTENTFQKIEGKNFISVKQNIDALWGVNYVMFQNTSYNVKWFYGFVTKLEYKNATTTYVHFEIDVLQTWMFTMNFKPSYVVREHCKLWEIDGSPVLNTLDEGLNYGNVYETVNVMNLKPYDGVLFLVIVTKSLIHKKIITDPITNADKTLNPGDIYPNINSAPQPLCYYVHPFKLDGSIPTCWDENDENIILSKPIDVLRAMYEMDDAINNVVSIYITDYMGFDLDVDSSGTIRFPSSNFVEVDIMYAVAGSTEQQYLNTLFVNDIKQYQPKAFTYTNKYADYRTVTESKLLMYPYTTLILDDLKGNRQVLKNEYIIGDDIIVNVRGSLGTSNKTSYSVDNYQVKDNIEPADLFKANLENAVMNNNPNDLPIITDMLGAFLQGNRNSIQNQLNSTIFGGWMDTMGSVMGGVSNSSANPSNMGEANPVGMVQSGMGVVKGMANTYFQTQGMIAKQKDINNTPPSLSKMGANTYFDYGHNLSGLYLIKRQITPEYQKKLEDFFNIFGYKKNEVKLPNFHTRQYWNYVQTSGCVITGNFNNEDLQELKSVFDNGVTLWHTDDIGNYALGNVVI